MTHLSEFEFVSRVVGRPTPVLPDIPHAEFWVDVLEIVADDCDEVDDFATTMFAIENANIPGVSMDAIQRVLTAAATAYNYAHEVAGELADGSIGYIELSTTSR